MQQDIPMNGGVFILLTLSTPCNNCGWQLLTMDISICTEPKWTECFCQVTKYRLQSTVADIEGSASQLGKRDRS